MKAYDFNDQWYFAKTITPDVKQKVQLPHDAMINEIKSESALGGINTGWYEGFDYVYTKEFDLSDLHNSSNVVFEFEGVYKNAEVYINDKKAGERPYGYTNFYVDATTYVNFDKPNEIKVIARNSDQPNSRWYSGAGIYRPITMWVSDENGIALNGVKIKTLKTEPAVIGIDIKTFGLGSLEINIWDHQNHIVSKLVHSTSVSELEIEIPDAKLWSETSPHMYVCEVKFGNDVVRESFGIRKLNWGQDGFKVNDERVILRGACIHHDHGIIGAASHYDAEERRVRILKESGYNAIRSAHNPCSKALLRACDKLGMFVVDELVDCWYIHKTHYDYVNYFEEWWRTDLTDMVNKDYNHPCVIMYSTGNEVSETAQPKGIELTGEMTEFLHALDDSRPVTCGINIFFNFLSSMGFGVYSDEKAKKAVKKDKTKAVGSEFFNNLAGILGDDFMKLGATLPPCDWKTKDAFANMDIAGYNYGIYRYKNDLKKYPNRLILGSETFCKDASSFYELAKVEPRIIGDFVWAGMDYLGEVAIGSWEYSDYAERFDKGLGWVSAGSGRIDLTGKPLAEAAYTKVAYDLMEQPVIAVRPVNHTHDKHSPSAWKMTNAIESWSWNGCEGNDAIVEVYSKGSYVKIFVNGNLVGKKKLKNRRTKLTTKYYNGVIEAHAYDSKGKLVSKAKLESAGEITKLQLSPEYVGETNGGLCYIRFKYVDEQGILKPLEKHNIKISVIGAELLGLGNGCPYQNRAFNETSTETYFGEALAILKCQNEEIFIEADDGREKVSLRVAVSKEGESN